MNAFVKEFAGRLQRSKCSGITSTSIRSSRCGDGLRVRLLERPSLQ
jgi:hypothetical protein